MPELKRAPINRHQIKMIHTLKNALKMHENIYRFYLSRTFGVSSSKDLDCVQGQGFIEHLKDEAIAAGVWNRADPDEEKFKKLEGRYGFATPAQLAFIEDLWRQVSRAKPEARDKALRTFLQRKVGVSDLRFLRDSHAGKIITALQAMKKQQKVKKPNV